MEKYNVVDVSNKLFCTFTARESVEDTIVAITSHYSVLYKKIFILETSENSEVLLTYNIDPHNSSSYILPNTILLHRKKETNTLYTINGLNALIKEINNGVLDLGYRVNWEDFKNTVLLTQGLNLRKLETKINRIVAL